MENLSRRSFLKSASSAALAITAVPTILTASRWQTVAWSGKPEKRAEQMKWFSDARYGMFIHWGPYAMLGRGEWVQHIGRIPFKEYEAAAASFNPVKFDAADFVRIAKAAGMKYMVITAKHHDGFCMWNSELTDYNIVKWTRFKRDVIAELAAECCAGEMTLRQPDGSFLERHSPTLSLCKLEAQLASRSFFAERSR